MHTVVELPEFIKRSGKLLNEAQRLNLINELANHPKTGDVMEGTGGIRKLRWSSQGRGKRGGVRVIYYYRNEDMPLFLLTVFGKGEMSNLTKHERNELSKFISILIKRYGVKK